MRAGLGEKMLAKGAPVQRTGGGGGGTACCFPQGLFLGSAGPACSRRRIRSRPQLGACSHRSVTLAKVWSPGLRFSTLGAAFSVGQAGDPVRAGSREAEEQGALPEAAGRKRGFEMQG